MRKEELREFIRRQKRQFTPQQLEELSLPVIARLRPLLTTAHTVMAYYSLPDEVYTHQLLDELVDEGKTVLLPRVLDAKTMELCHYTGQDDLRRGAFHIMEPIGEHFSDLSSIDLVLTPGVAFDAQGHRLGRGRGYYDRFLSSLRTVLGEFTRVIGVCFDFQKVPEVPVDANDIPVDIVV